MREWSKIALLGEILSFSVTSSFFLDIFIASSRAGSWLRLFVILCHYFTACGIFEDACVKVTDGIKRLVGSANVLIF